MPNLNRCLIAGHLGRNAEFSTTTSGYPIGRCSVAVTSRIKRGGEWGEEVEWFKCVLLGERYTKIQDRLTKGAAVFVEGRLQTRSWDDKDGQKRYITELIADNLQLLGGGTGTAARANQPPRPDARAADPPPSDDDEDSVPF